MLVHHSEFQIPQDPENHNGFGDLTKKGSYIFGHLGSPGISGVIWVLIAFFCRLYILLCILSINAFGHFGLGKCKLVILRSRFHCKTHAGFGDLTKKGSYILAT